MQRRRLTDKHVRSLKPAPSGKRIEIFDATVPSFGIRVTDRGKKSWILYLRWPGSCTAARRKLGKFPNMPLKDAREKAWEWLRLVENGVDPKQKLKEELLEKKRRDAATFTAVAEAWFVEIKKTQRKAAEVESDVRREFVAPLGPRPITSITEEEIADIIIATAADRPAQARNLLGYAKRMFRWAVGRRAYGIKQSPVALLRAEDLAGKKVIRKRVLSDDELREVWHAAEETEYPYGPCFRMLILTGQRKSDVGEAQWSEFNLVDRVWLIPAERMKMAVAHAVPLTDDVVSLLASLPRFKGGDYLFSTTFGARPANGYSKAKERLDEFLKDLIDIKIEKNKWVIHDLRRTMRTNLSALPIPENVKELMIAHQPGGMHAVYDQWSYIDEKRRGFDLYAARLRGIVSPPESGGNVVAMHR